MPVLAEANLALIHLLTIPLTLTVGFLIGYGVAARRAAAGGAGAAPAAHRDGSPDDDGL